jgi:DNA-binding NarL/FixJ family response regulator
LRLITKGTWFLWGVRGTRRDESRWLTRALDLAERDPGRIDLALLGHGLHALGMYLHRIGEYQRAHDLIETGIRNLRDADDRTGVAVALGNLANLLHDRGDFDGARAALGEAIAIHRQFDDPKRLIIPLINLGAIGLTAGDLAAAQAAIDEAGAVIHQAGNARDVAYLNYFRGAIAVHNGNAAAAETHLAEALAQFRALPDSQGVAMTPKYLAQALLLTGQSIAAARVLTEAFPVLLRMDLQPNASLSLDTLADIAIRVGQAADGARILGASAAIRASLNADAGRLVDREYLAALTASARAVLGPDRFLAAETAGRHLSFDAVMTEALALAESIAGAEAATQQETPSAPTRLFDVLTARERDILKFLVEGLSDREIADRLSLSPRTVSNHVGRILAKLDAPSRTAAVAIALRDGLL